MLAHASEALKSWRTKRGLTLIQMAAMVSAAGKVDGITCDPSTLCMIENGKRGLSLAMATVLERVTGISLASWCEANRRVVPRKSIGDKLADVNDRPSVQLQKRGRQSGNRAAQHEGGRRRKRAAGGSR